MSNTDNASLNPNSEENIIPSEPSIADVHTYNNSFLSATSPSTFSIAQSGAVNNSVDGGSQAEVLRQPPNDLSMKIIQQTQQAEETLHQFMAPSLLSTFAHDFSVIQEQNIMSLFPRTSYLLGALTSIQPTLPQLKNTYRSLGIGASAESGLSQVKGISQIAGLSAAPFVSFNRSHTEQFQPLLNNFASFYTPSLVEIGNAASSMLSAWSLPIMTEFQQSLVPFLESPFLQLASTIKSLDLLNSSWFPLIELRNQFQIVNSLLPTWNLIFDLTNTINTSIGAIPELFKHLRKEVKRRALSAFKHIRFCFAPSISEDLMYWILEQVEAGNSNIVVARLCNDYARNGCARLQRMIERWLDNPEFARRQPIIWQAFQSHSRKEYISSMRVLAPEIEGISKQLLIQNTPLKSPEAKQGLSQLHSPKLTIVGALHEAIDKAYINTSDADIVSWVRFKSTVEFAEEEFIKKVNFSSEYNSLRRGKYSRNRHGNLHGMQLNGFTAANSLRLFMMLDAMYEIFQSYILRGGIM